MYSVEKINESSFAKIQIEEIPNNKRIFSWLKKGSHCSLYLTSSRYY